MQEQKLTKSSCKAEVPGQTVGKGKAKRRQQVLSTEIEAKIARKKSNVLEDLGHSINKSGKATTRLGKEQSQLQDEILVRAFTPACDHDQFPLHMHVTMLQSDNSKHSQKQRRYF